MVSIFQKYPALSTPIDSSDGQIPDPAPALADGTKAGVQAEGKIRTASQMTLDEAQKILDVSPSATLAEIQKVKPAPLIRNLMDVKTHAGYKIVCYMLAELSEARAKGLEQILREGFICFSACSAEGWPSFGVLASISSEHGRSFTAAPEECLKILPEARDTGRLIILVVSKWHCMGLKCWERGAHGVLTGCTASCATPLMGSCGVLCRSTSTCST